MILEKRNVRERISQINFDSRTNIDAEFICSHCGDITHFTSRDFIKHYASFYSIFDLDLKKYFDDFSEIKHGIGESFIDFYCHKCGSPIRIIFMPMMEYAMGVFEYEIIRIIEKK